MKDKKKQIIRERILTLLRNQKEEERLKKSLLICDKLIQLQEYQDALTILFYASFDGEVITVEMISQAKKDGKKIALPRVEKENHQIIPILVENFEDLEIGPYGIQQPKENTKAVLDTKTLDVVIVPGVAFDRQNNRLGRGGGYYDRFLKELSSSTQTFGLAYDFQLVDSLPTQTENDVPVSKVLVN